MSSKPIISIVGLGLTGTSLGLGLKRQDGNFEIVGHDKVPDAGNAASRLGAVDRTSWNLYNSVENAELIVLATPLDEMEELLTLLREDLREGCLVLAMAKVMQPAIELGSRLLPDNVHFVVAHPIVTGVGGALTPRADLYEDVPFCLATSVDTDPTAMQLASDFVERIGATPLYMDVQEHDGLIAMVEQLPQFMAAVLLDSVRDSSAWVEGARVAGRLFAQSTELGSGPERLFHDFGSNRENLLTRIDQFQQSLSKWREMLASDLDLLAKTEDEDRHPLLTSLQQSQRTREHWETQVILKDWDIEPLPETPSSRGLMQQMFFGNLFRGREDRLKASPNRAGAGTSSSTSAEETSKKREEI